MFCPNCGCDCKDAKFCPNCGTSLKNIKMSATEEEVPAEVENVEEQQSVPPLKEPYYREINGHRIDLNQVVRIYGNKARKIGSYAYLQTECGITFKEGKQIMDQVYAAHQDEDISFFGGMKDSFLMEAERRRDKSEAVREQKRSLKNQIKEDQANGIVCCPKCGSRNVSANKKGFSFGKAVLGSCVGLDVGLLAGGSGSNKIILTCMNCGYQWKPGKK